MIKPNNMTWNELKQAESNVTAYINLVDEFLSISHGKAWTQADGERGEKLRVEIGRFRQALDMEPKQGFLCAR